MIRYFIILCLYSFPLYVTAQFKASYNGFITSENKEYLVLQYDQKSVHDLYLLTMKWINRTQYNPNIYTKDIEDASVYVHTSDTIKLPGILKTIVHIDYGLNFEFKDGKVKILPIIHTITSPLYTYFGYEGKKNNLNNLVLFKPDGSYQGKNGKIFSEILGDWLNKKVRQYDDFVKSSGGEDDW